MNLETVGRYALLTFLNQESGPDCLVVVDVEGDGVWLEALTPGVLMQAMAEGAGHWLPVDGELHCMAPVHWLKAALPKAVEDIDSLAERSRVLAKAKARERLN
jgi:hypothetical protein